MGPVYHTRSSDSHVDPDEESERPLCGFCGDEDDVGHDEEDDAADRDEEEDEKVDQSDEEEGLKLFTEFSSRSTKNSEEPVVFFRFNQMYPYAA